MFQVSLSLNHDEFNSNNNNNKIRANYYCYFYC